MNKGETARNPEHVTVWSHWAIMSGPSPLTTMTSGKKEMSSKKSEAERAAAKAPSLAKQYRAIGPAAIVAALICTPKKKPAKTAKAA